MTFLSSTSRLIPGMMSLGVLGHQMKVVPKEWGPGMKGPSTGKLIKNFTGTMVSIPMIKPVSTMVSAL